MRITITKAVTLAAVLGAMPAAAQEKQCYESWSAAAAVVKQERLVALEQLSEHADVTLGGSIVKATLCSAGQRYFYRLVVRLPGGLMRIISRDAREPPER